MKTEDILRLPKWAQSLIGRLQRDLDAAKRTIAEMTPGEAITNVMLEHGFGEDVKLPNNSRVRFQTEHGYFSIHHRGDLQHGIAVYGHGNYLWDVAILPAAVNGREVTA